MSQRKISGGVVHEMPADLRRALASDTKALTAWEDITPLARNEWICWIESAKKAETRTHVGGALSRFVIESARPGIPCFRFFADRLEREVARQPDWAPPQKSLHILAPDRR